MNSEPPQVNDSRHQSNNKSFVFGLLLAFAPAAMLLGLFTCATAYFWANWPWEMVLVPCLVSVACCLVSSFMLFSRRTGLAIAIAAVFLILNGLIAFFFGCSTFFSATIHHG